MSQLSPPRPWIFPLVTGYLERVGSVLVAGLRPDAPQCLKRAPKATYCDPRGRIMIRRTSLVLCGLMFTGLLAVAAPAPAHAQVAVNAYSGAQPVITYLPEKRGLFGQRLV
jgi:hypothetical protein